MEEYRISYVFFHLFHFAVFFYLGKLPGMFIPCLQAFDR